MLGLRTALGVDEEEVRPVVDMSALDRLIAQGCLERRCGRLRLNPGFLDVSNSVILFWPLLESHSSFACRHGTH